jgi:hypothetical protein
MTGMILLSVVLIAVLIVGLAFYLVVLEVLLSRIAAHLEQGDELVAGILADAKIIRPGVDHINRTGGVVAGALPLLFNMAEGIVKGVSPQPPREEVIPTAYPASGVRRSRLLDGVGFGGRGH